jgi:hypothetical protein
MKSEEQTWQLLFYIGIKHLKKCFEVSEGEKRREEKI